MNECLRIILGSMATLVVTGFMALAQEVSVPDPGLNAAIREALQKPAGPLTEQDLLSLSILSAGGRQIKTVEGLEAARNLRILDLDSNSLTNFPIAGALTNLAILDLFNNRLASFVLSNASPGLTIIDLAFNSLTQCSLPPGLTNLDTLFLENNLLANFNLPAGLTGLTQLDLSANQLTSFNPPPDMTNILTLLIFANQLTNATLSGNWHRLVSLDLDFNRLRSLAVPAGLTNLTSLTLLGNQLTNVSLAGDMRQLRFLDIGANQLSTLALPAGLRGLSFLRLNANRLTSFILPPGTTNLTGLFLSENQLTNVTLPSDLSQLVQIDLGQNQLASFTFPPGMTNLITVDLNANQLTELTLPADLTNLASLFVDANPLATFVLSEVMAGANLAGLVASLPNRGVSVFTYPLAVQLSRLRQPIGAFQFAIAGPPGVYVVFGSTNLADWSGLSVASNTLGAVVFTDGTAHLSTRKFYRTLLQSPPVNMVFVAANTFTMGSPANEQDRSSNEGPQTTVTLTRGFWMGKYEVTQGEYSTIMDTNPSPTPHNSGAPVSNVSWLDATNYCAKLTQRELAAGRISAGSHYRLPTEAEWECATRAGTTTRFSYGDDPDYTELSDHSWYASNSGLKAHPVGQKLPNPWGLYDMEGNVVEWCQDWFGLLPGGVQTDPTGPVSSTSGRKVVRGGAFDNSEQSCRSASRLLFSAFPPLTDSDLGFRVVLVTGP
jgi:formylglycine-generating enzyme required for sulfatase activity